MLCPKTSLSIPSGIYLISVTAPATGCQNNCALDRLDFEMPAWTLPRTLICCALLRTYM
ncbi:hypothetical protein BD310DRAFT_922042 [Dichomitus squalens]|uniref:Uncharacterized protein n=1 Tax=Dichomitus squalens TaxID=114155 RepID=A0A4V2K8P4_9APHY|nr:hypothetical protein BD310DRAFT_922042 [Dichomitus squalens]